LRSCRPYATGKGNGSIEWFKKRADAKRRAMVSAVRSGMSISDAARRWRVDRATVRRWVDRAGDRRLDRVDFESRSSRPIQTTRTTDTDEDLVIEIRTELKEKSVLGEYGADAILRELSQRSDAPSLSRTTISRILRRRGAVEKRRRIRHPSPPRGWYLPDVARGEKELDSFDFIEDFVFKGKPRFDVLTGISLLGGIPAAFVHPRRSANLTVEHLIAHWRRHGIPGYAQFDNGVVFKGPHRYPDTISRVVRLCLSLRVVPVFAPPREHGVQNIIEGFNSLWRQKVWQRDWWSDQEALQAGSDAYIHALLTRRARRVADAPPRRKFPSDWQLDFNVPFRGSMIYLRRAEESGHAEVLGHRFYVRDDWAHRLVRAEINLDLHEINFWGLRRKDPGCQPLLQTLPHTVVQKRFRG
jgi:transposase